MFIHVISVNILMFLLSSTISTLNQFEVAVNLSDEEICLDKIRIQQTCKSALTKQT
jgi:hypothetical protein